MEVAGKSVIEVDVKDEELQGLVVVVLEVKYWLVFGFMWFSESFSDSQYSESESEL